MKVPAEILVSLVSIVTNVVEFFLSLRIVLKLFGASSAAPFVTWVYETTEPLLTPFSGMFPAPSLSAGLVIEFSSIFALLVYAFIGYLVVEVLENIQYYASRRGSKKRGR